MVKKVLESGNAFEGKNGPYNNKDTALRNSTHWYQIFAFLYHETKEEIYKECSDRLLLFITNAENYGSNMAPKCRTDANIDDINGLMDQHGQSKALFMHIAIRVNSNYLILHMIFFCRRNLIQKITCGELLTHKGKIGAMI